ncbi:MAG: AAA family ATPase [Desulfobulbaceae bacterium]|nr:AAA family ATPase [Desulfobulbaceae bacterium]
MRIKRFEATDITTAMAMVKAEMGDEAVILATKTIGASHGNIVKKGQETKVEVIAALDYDLESITDDEPIARQTRPSRSEEKPKKIPSPSPRQRSATIARSNDKENSTSHLEAHDLRLRFSGMLKQHQPRQEATSPANKSKKPARPNPQEVSQWRDKLIDQLSISTLPEIANGKGQTIIALVGATGVGKTTTAAKLAAWFSLHNGMSVAMLSMDCYRIGATDQLRTYAKIMRLPCEIVLRKKDMDSALARHTDKDVIIIDTAGKSPYDQQHINELKEWFGNNQNIRPYLVLSATTKKEDLASTISGYQPLSICGLILSKIDETRTYATLCQQVVTSQLPVASICTGQRVPEDLMIANKPFLAKLFRQGWDAVIAERALISEQDNWITQPQRSAS